MIAGYLRLDGWISSILIFSNNFRRFRLDEAAVAQFAHCVEITRETLAPDFERDARIHRCWKLTRL